MFISVLLAGCTIYVADPVDVPALVPYQKLKPGTSVVVVLRTGVTINGVEVDSPLPPIQQEGILAWISKDTVGLLMERDGQLVRVNYAGRMIREIRMLKNEPIQPPMTTRGK